MFTSIIHETFYIWTIELENIQLVKVTILNQNWTGNPLGLQLSMGKVGVSRKNLGLTTLSWYKQLILALRFPEACPEYLV